MLYKRRLLFGVLVFAEKLVRLYLKRRRQKI
jgi:hypothetical protein